VADEFQNRLIIQGLRLNAQIFVTWLARIPKKRTKLVTEMLFPHLIVRQ
jgi:hypothetical protein